MYVNNQEIRHTQASWLNCSHEFQITPAFKVISPELSYNVRSMHTECNIGLKSNKFSNTLHPCTAFITFFKFQSFSNNLPFSQNICYLQSPKKFCNFSVKVFYKKWETIQHYTQIQIQVKEQHFYCCSTFQSQKGFQQ